MSGSRANKARTNIQRERLAHDIARLMWEYRIEDFRLAKDKAVKQFGLRRTELPDNQAISAALNAYVAIFNNDGQSAQLKQRLLLAKSLMEKLSGFDPRAVGLEAGVAILPGATLHLHVFSEPPEAFDIYLQENGTEYQLEDKRFRFGADDYETRPSFKFEHHGASVCVSVFPLVARNRVPLSPVDGKPIRRITLREVDEMVSGLPGEQQGRV